MITIYKIFQKLKKKIEKKLKCVLFNKTLSHTIIFSSHNMAKFVVREPVTHDSHTSASEDHSIISGSGFKPDTLADLNKCVRTLLDFYATSSIVNHKPNLGRSLPSHRVSGPNKSKAAASIEAAMQIGFLRIAYEQSQLDGFLPIETILKNAISCGNAVSLNTKEVKITPGDIKKTVRHIAEISSEIKMLQAEEQTPEVHEQIKLLTKRLDALNIIHSDQKKIMTSTPPVNLRQRAIGILTRMANNKYPYGTVNPYAVYIHHHVKLALCPSAFAPDVYAAPKPVAASATPAASAPSHSDDASAEKAVFVPPHLRGKKVAKVDDDGFTEVARRKPSGRSVSEMMEKGRRPTASGLSVSEMMEKGRRPVGSGFRTEAERPKHQERTDHPAPLASNASGAYVPRHKREAGMATAAPVPRLTGHDFPSVGSAVKKDLSKTVWGKVSSSVLAEPEVEQPVEETVAVSRAPTVDMSQFVVHHKPGQEHWDGDGDDDEYDSDEYQYDDGLHPSSPFYEMDDTVDYHVSTGAAVPTTIDLGETPENWDD